MKTTILKGLFFSKISAIILVKELTPHTKSSSAYPRSSFFQGGFCKKPSAKLAQVAEPAKKWMWFIALLLFGFGRRTLWLNRISAA